MIDNRQKAAMLIAVINKISKTLDYQVAVGHVVDLEALFEDRLNFSKLADELIEYLDQEPADKLARQLMLLTRLAISGSTAKLFLVALSNLTLSISLIL